MAVKIGHASVDENGRATGGASGDQTSKELCIRNWYASSWDVVLRPKNSQLAEKSAMACEAGCANSRIGYDQYQRNTLYARAKEVNFDLSKITTACECDCSAFMHTCAIAGGANLTYGSNGYTTRNMVAAFVKSGNYQKLTDSKYLKSDQYLKRGDILVNEGSHTAMVLEDGTLANSTVAESPKVPIVAGKAGIVKEWQLAAIMDGFKFPKYGSDGEWGAECSSVAQKAVCRRRSTYKYKHLTKIVQRAVGVNEDGLFGRETEQAVIAYQRKHGLLDDGQVGLNTWKVILGVK